MKEFSKRGYLGFTKATRPARVSGRVAYISNL